MRPFAKTFNSNDPNPVYFPMQESKTVPGSTVKAALGIVGTTTTTTTTTTDPGSPAVWNVSHDGGTTLEWGKGIRVKSSTSGGNLVVHLAENDDGTYDTYDIPAGGGTSVYKEGLIYDQVIASGTTIDLDDVSFLL
jgi:hypothetical protein